jgi:hypothetical protein
MARALLAAALLATAQAMVGRVPAAEAAIRAATGASCVAKSAVGPIATRGMLLDEMEPFEEKISSPIPAASGVLALDACMAFERNILESNAASYPSMATSAGVSADDSRTTTSHKVAAATVGRGRRTGGRRGKQQAGGRRPVVGSSVDRLATETVSWTGGQYNAREGATNPSAPVSPAGPRPPCTARAKKVPPVAVAAASPGQLDGRLDGEGDCDEVLSGGDGDWAIGDDEADDREDIFEAADVALSGEEA